MISEEATMRTLSTLATLLLGLAVVFWAPAANADCPHNGNDTHQHCGGDPGDPAPSTNEMILNLLEPKLVFVTNEKFTGNLGGLAGADEKCQAAADAAGFGGIFQAWLSAGDPGDSSSISTPTNRWDTLALNPYFLIGERLIAANYASLIDIIDGGKLITRPLLTETGVGTPGGDYVWTGTTSKGTLASEDCDDWTSEEGTVTGVAGDPNYNDANWTVRGDPITCSTLLRLYCFEQ